MFVCVAHVSRCEAHERPWRIFCVEVGGTGCVLGLRGTRGASHACEEPSRTAPPGARAARRLQQPKTTSRGCICNPVGALAVSASRAPHSPFPPSFFLQVSLAHTPPSTPRGVHSPVAHTTTQQRNRVSRPSPKCTPPAAPCLPSGCYVLRQRGELCTPVFASAGP